MTKTTLFETMKKLWHEFETAHNGATKKSQAEARKIINDFKKIVTDYRKASVEEGKNK
jgi:ClpP class serine protease